MTVLSLDSALDVLYTAKTDNTIHSLGSSTHNDPL